MKGITYFLVLILLPVCSGAQPVSDDLIDRVNRRFSQVKSYEADAMIRTDISFLKILPQKAKIYYQRPDRFRVQTQGISILPKQNFDHLFRLLARRDSYEAIPGGIDPKTGWQILTILPLGDTLDLVLAKLWIDPQKELIRKSQLTTRSNGTVLVDYAYGDQADKALPSQITFTIDVKKFKVPKAVSADINSKSAVPEANPDAAKTGKIVITMNSYRVNIPIDPLVFTKK